MINRLAPLWLVVGLVVGYAISGPSARAQEVGKRLPSGVNQGDTVTLSFAYQTLSSGGYSMTCTVAGISDTWVRCAAADGLDGSRDRTAWFDLTRVVKVTKQER